VRWTPSDDGQVTVADDRQRPSGQQVEELRPRDRVVGRGRPQLPHLAVQPDGVVAVGSHHREQLRVRAPPRVLPHELGATPGPLYEAPLRSPARYARTDLRDLNTIRSAPDLAATSNTLDLIRLSYVAT